MTPPPGKKPTPPAGVPLLDDEWETSEVREAPARPPTNPSYSPSQPASARKALAMVTDLRRDFNRFEQRQYEHNKEMLERFDEHAKEDRQMFSRLGDSLSGVREQNAAQTVEIRQIRHDLKNQQMVDVEEKRVEAELKVHQKKTDIEDTAAQKKFKREIFLKAVSILAPIFAALGGGLALLLQQCS
jgi:hypothetical protein